MNLLESHILNHALDPIQTMNRLQDRAGVISDNCVMPCDVADDARAVLWLMSEDRPVLAEAPRVQLELF